MLYGATLMLCTHCVHVVGNGST
uniref:Uncharacterized protein n=1 Tax=Nelumbo nucifera TaxID=4432 RepID=A0A822XR27_NELNU|nr:TPA_asm: hypothetical protein HUJ06_023022 [Nelumbo nucifera]